MLLPFQNQKKFKGEKRNKEYFKKKKILIILKLINEWKPVELYVRFFSEKKGREKKTEIL